MFVRSVKCVYMLVLLQCISARIAVVPRFYGQDSAVIVDADQQKFNPKLHNALYYNLPVYKLINPGSVPKAATTTTTMKPTFNEEEYPSDLLYIARNKLGFKRTDQLPSISELGELLGTGSAADTAKYIRTLTSNDQGLALMKSYLSSIDYDTESANNYVAQPKDDEDNNATNNADMDVDYEDVPPIKQPQPETTTTTMAPLPVLEEGSLMQRVNDFMKQYSFSWSDSSTTPKPATYQPVFVPPVRSVQPATKVMRPVLVRQPLPYHYPIPMRPVLLAQTVKTTPMPAIIPSTTAAPNLSTQASLPPHLNTPKKSSDALVAPHIRQLAEIANIPAQVLDQFLQQQPKLAALAQRVSRLPLVEQHSRAIDSQLLVAVKKALFQDESFKCLLAAAQTLK